MSQRTIRDRVAAVDAVLWEIWDPIGVNHEPGTRDEYTTYAPGVVGLLERGASDDDIERHLATLVQEQMGMTYIHPERTRRTLAALRALSAG